MNRSKTLYPSNSAYTASEASYINSFIPENIPKRFTERPQWVNWRFELRDGKPTKVPYTPGTRRRASSTNLLTWRPFEDAMNSLEEFDGIGFMFCSADPFIGIDFDNCRNPETGEVEQWALQIIDTYRFKYVEASPSGSGVHLITRGVLKEGVNNTLKVGENREERKVEVYGQDRFFTMTGAVL